MRRLFRAVSLTELHDIRAQRGVFRDSRNASGKGFFFERAGAENFAKWAAMDDGEAYFIVATEAPDDVVARGTPHRAAREGLGVYLWSEDLPQLIPETEEPL